MKKRSFFNMFLKCFTIEIPLQTCDGFSEANIQKKVDSVAQLVEHLPFKERVLGSRPSGITFHYLTP